MLLMIAMAGALCVPQPASALANSASETALRLSDAQVLADRAQRTATEMQLSVSVVIVSREGRVILLHRMDNSSFLNLAFAEAKTATAAAIGAPTSLLEEAVDAGKIFPALRTGSGDDWRGPSYRARR